MAPVQIVQSSALQTLNGDFTTIAFTGWYRIENSEPFKIRILRQNGPSSEFGTVFDPAVTAQKFNNATSPDQLVIYRDQMGLFVFEKTNPTTVAIGQFYMDVWLDSGDQIVLNRILGVSTDPARIGYLGQHRPVTGPMQQGYTLN